MAEAGRGARGEHGSPATERDGAKAGARGSRGGRAERERQANLALGLLVAAALVTGTVLFGAGTAAARWWLGAHAVAGLGLLILTPIKSRVVGRGWGRHRETRWASAALAALAIATVASGLAHMAGLRGIGPLSVMQVHVPAAIVAGVLAVWHALSRPARPRRTDWSRRTALRSAGTLVAAAAGWGALEGVLRVSGAPGGDRRFTGSHRAPAPIPTIWFNDEIPEIDPATWRLRVLGAGPAAADGARTSVESAPPRELALEDLPAAAPLDATIDCTNGWYARATWAAVALADLFGDPGAARSFVVTSATGYQRRYPVRDLGRVYLATGLAGEPLPRVHGGPARVVAPGRRGFWWVKWVVEIRLDDAPWWRQPPFPLT